jgi:hypothetical protein
MSWEVALLDSPRSILSGIEISDQTENSKAFSQGFKKYQNSSNLANFESMDFFTGKCYVS